MEEQFRLRKVYNTDSSLLFEWANDPDVRENALNQKKIEWEAHQIWFSTRMKDSQTEIFILEKDNIPVGQVRFEKEDEHWKIDYSIDKNFRGLGLGKKIILKGLKKINGKIRAWVKKENIPSQKIFESLGFIKSEQDDLLLYTKYN